jgi:hypothetical protein
MIKRTRFSIGASIGLIALIAALALLTPRISHAQNKTMGPAPPALLINSSSERVLETGRVNTSERGVRLGTPVQINGNVTIPFGGSFASKAVYSVPTDKRLVIEHVSLTSIAFVVASNNIKVDLGSKFEGATFVYPLDMRLQSPVNGRFFVANHPQLAFADPGTDVTLTVTLDEPHGGGFGFHCLTRYAHWLS